MNMLSFLPPFPGRRRPYTALAALVAGVAGLPPTTFAASGPDSETASGAYVAIALGASGLGLVDVSTLRVSTDHGDLGGKLALGYRLNERYGVELGYARLRGLEGRFSLGAGTVTQRASGRSLYAAATATWPLIDRLSFTGKLGYAFNHVDGTDVLPAADSLIGSRRYGMLGLGLNVNLRPGLDLTAELDSYGKLSRQVRGSLLGVGLKQAF